LGLRKLGKTAENAGNGGSGGASATRKRRWRASTFSFSLWQTEEARLMAGQLVGKSSITEKRRREIEGDARREISRVNPMIRGFQLGRYK